jgi:hypothetical protein
MRAWVKESRYPRSNVTFFYVFREGVSDFASATKVDKILPHVIQLWKDGFRVTSISQPDAYTDIIIFETELDDEF